MLVAATEIPAGRLKSHVRMLASNGFHGRGPAQIGEKPTLEYLIKQMKASGLSAAGPGGSWLQPVPMIRITRTSAKLFARVGKIIIPLRPGMEVTATASAAGRTLLNDAPIVFGGYGVTDRKLGFDPFAGADLRGKVVMLLWGDPDVEAGRDLGFGGRAQTFAGRTGEKVAALQGRGVAGIVTVHEDFPASYPFSQIAKGDAVPLHMLDQGQPIPTSGDVRLVMRSDVAKDLLRRAGLDYAALKRSAQDKDFRAVQVKNSSLSADVSATADRVVSKNVIGMVKGRDRAAETVLFGAHWDAYGENAFDLPGDPTRNGAIDNAIGTAELIEIARAFARGPKPRRSVLFAAWTAEEKGLLGASWYAAHPLRPLATTAAVFNLDPHLALGRARNLDLIGPGRTPLEADLARVARRHGLRLDNEVNSEAGWYFRSDHYAFAAKGVPTVYFRAGQDLVEGGRAKGGALTAAYNARCYHQPCDEYDPRWTLGGAVQEAQVALALGKEVANSSRWPGWNPGSQFAPLRQQTAAARR
ncbi:MAG TPA: M28 family peptidase [Sphingomicrobium sp.]|nr:M28 family peptidase [Sphingomicrobium sp.]